MAQFFIPDTSPLLAYAPCSNCGAANGWVSAYSPRGDGYDQTFRQAGNGNSTVAMNLTASSVDIWTGAAGGCAATYSIDGGAWAEGCTIPSFPAGRHLLAVRPKAGAQKFQFHGLSGKTLLSGQGTYKNVTVDDVSPLFTYNGAWTRITSRGPVGVPANATVAGQYTTSGNGFYNSSGSISTAEGASMSLSFEGSGVYVFGMAGPEGGSAEVKVDGVVANRLNMTNPWRAYSSLLFFATGLEATKHDISITNLTPGRQLVLDYALVTSVKARSSGPNLPLIIGCIAGVSLVLLIAGVASYIYYIRRSRRPRRPPGIHPYGFSSGISYRDISPGQASSIDSWRKNATVNIPPTPSSGSGSGTGSGSHLSGLHFYAAHVQPGTGSFNTAGSPGPSPPPEYPDYLPYRGPIEPRPTTPPPPPGHAGTPLIAGVNASTQGWLAATAAALSPSPSGRSATRGQRTIHRPEPIPLRDRHTAEMDDIPLDSYYAQQDLISPASTLSSLGLSGMTARAMGATRSVARLWPTSVVIDSQHHLHLPPTTPQSAPTDSALSRPAKPQRALSSNSAQFAPSYHGAAPSAHSCDQLLSSGVTGGSLASFPSGQTSGTETGTGMMTSPMTPLRRGVSIKSVKTMRSFFSGLLFANSPIPDTPAVPSTYISERYEVARPESEIFPQSSISRAGSIVRHRPDALQPLNRFSPSKQTEGEGWVSSGGAHTAGSGSVSSGSTPWAERNQTTRREARDESRRARTPSWRLPPIRLDRGGENFFIELNPNSPVTMVNGSRPGSEMPTPAAPTSWRYV